MRPAGHRTRSTLANAGEVASAFAAHDHAVALAQLEAQAAAVERLDAAYAGLERTLARVAELRARADSPAPVAVSRDQLRLVVGG